MKMLIKNGRIVDPANRLDQIADLLIDNGKIAKLGTKLSNNEDAETIDATGLIVAPGLIDMHVHLREPGREDKETIATATRAAARGGFTTVLGMPNTDPVMDDQTAVEFVAARSKRDGIVNVYTTGSATKGQKGKELADMWELRNSGAIAVTDDGRTIPSADVTLKVLKYAKMLGLPYLSHAEEPSMRGVMHEGLISTEMGLEGKPSVAEDIVVAREIILAEYEDAQVHFCHGSTKGTVELVALAKKRGIKVTVETCPQYFSLTDKAVLGYNLNAKMNPPLRSEDHVNAVKRALHDDVIDVIATDHAPHLLSEKFLEYDDAASGIVGLETAVPLVMNNLVHANILTLSQAISKMTTNPAKILKIPKGTLSVGVDADVTIIDMNKEEIINAAEFESKGRNTPFNGMKLKGVPVMTIVGGRIVMKDRKVIV